MAERTLERMSARDRPKYGRSGAHTGWRVTGPRAISPFGHSEELHLFEKAG